MESAILSSVTDGIIGRLSSAAVQEIGRLWGVHEEISRLEDTILTIKAVVLDAEQKQVHNNQIKTWLSRLEGVANEADDLVDGVSTEALRRQVMSGNNMAKKTISSGGVTRRNSSCVQGEKPYSFVSPKDVVIGRDNDRTKILELLLETKTEENVWVVPIVGSGGLGTTTLARLVFNDEKVQKHFDLKMWVCVSTSFDVKLVVENIIKSTTNDNEMFENSALELLQKKLQQKINGNQYLLVLDDVWNENRDLWLNLRNLLLSGSDGSRIIITTRSILVAKITTTVKPYILGNLDEDESWCLFKEMAFEEGQEPNNSNMVEIGKKFVKKCGGNPLALRTIRGMLYSKDKETEWLSFYKTEFSKISQDETDILPTLKLSYDCLSSNLKHCFAYCSLFPKDHKINVKDRINLWMAQGFIKASETTQEDVGHQYSMELYWRSFFQEVEESICGDVISCKMHDLAMQVAGAECAMLPPDSKSIDRRTRHLSFDFWLISSKHILLCFNQKIRLEHFFCVVNHGREL